MDFDLSIEIRRPAADVFAFLADVQRYGDHRPGSLVPIMEKVPAGTTRLGTRWHEVVRLGPFAHMTIWSEVTALDPPRRLGERFHAWWMEGRLEYTIECAGEGSTLRQREYLEPRGPLRALDGVVRRMLRPNLVRRLAGIRDLLESGVAVVPHAGGPTPPRSDATGP